MYLKSITITITVFLVLFSCSKTEQNTEENLNPNVHKVVVEEVVQDNAYTYLRVVEQDSERWLAITKREVEEDEILYYSSSMRMNNFESKELDRTFETVYFVDNISDKPIAKMNMDRARPSSGDKGTVERKDISIGTVNGGVSIAEVFSARDAHSGQTVLIKGVVIKFNAQIMDRNWVHIQDGTSDKNNFDLTITTNDMVKVGDVVTFKGKITLNKDFGAGYSYEVIMEEAKLLPLN